MTPGQRTLCDKEKICNCHLRTYQSIYSPGYVVEILMHLKLGGNNNVTICYTIIMKISSDKT